jgi:hypothetical protein
MEAASYGTGATEGTAVALGHPSARRPVEPARLAAIVASSGMVKGEAACGFGTG